MPFSTYGKVVRGIATGANEYFTFNQSKAKQYNIDNTFVHCFMDGRDTDPKSGKGFIEQLEVHLAKNTGSIASIIGRFYAMDRDKRWERVKIA